ncbi:hypothetical protein DL96DRAFT_1738469 [Flagelloscypha sp. PMI_526]|nr:hypothetical protein DL96DRAFT_1738469 [Flagelloscypha sp. PMI_526]
MVRALRAYLSFVKTIETISGPLSELTAQNVAGRAKIDAELTKLRRKFQALTLVLHVKRNVFAPFANLPVEILSRIFLIIKDDFIYCHGPWPYSLDVAWWPPQLTHVCAYWRNVALGYAQLWTDPPLASTHWTREMFARSKGASLNIFCDEDFFDNDWNHYAYLRRLSNLWGMIGNCSRIRSLRISSEPFQGENLWALLNMLRNPAPMLESFHFVCVTSATSTFPEDLFSGSAPRLSKFELRGGTLTWASSLFQSHITELVMGSYGSHTECVGDILGALSCMSGCLQLLDLRSSCIPAVNSLPLDRRVPLPFLSILRLLGGLRECLDLTDHLILPTTVIYDLNCSSIPPDSFHASYKLALPLLAQAVPAKTLRILYQPNPIFPSSLSITLRSHSDTSAETEIDTLRLTLPFTSLQGRGTVEDNVSEICAQFKLENLQNISTNTALELKAWYTLFRRSKKLSSIDVSHNGVKTLIETMKWNLHHLTRKEKSSRASASLAPLFPELHDLTLTGAIFETTYSFPNTSWKNPASDILFVAKRRFRLLSTGSKKRKFRLRTLTLKHCQIDKGQETILRECEAFVDELEMDENIFDNEDEDDEDDEESEEDFSEPYWTDYSYY